MKLLQLTFVVLLYVLFASPVRCPNIVAKTPSPGPLTALVGELRQALEDAAYHLSKVVRQPQGMTVDLKEHLQAAIVLLEDALPLTEGVIAEAYDYVQWLVMIVRKMFVLSREIAIIAKETLGLAFCTPDAIELVGRASLTCLAPALAAVRSLHAASFDNQADMPVQPAAELFSLYGEFVTVYDLAICTRQLCTVERQYAKRPIEWTRTFAALVQHNRVGSYVARMDGLLKSVEAETQKLQEEVWKSAKEARKRTVEAKRRAAEAENRARVAANLRSMTMRQLQLHGPRSVIASSRRLIITTVIATVLLGLVLAYLSRRQE